MSRASAKRSKKALQRRAQQPNTSSYNYALQTLLAQVAQMQAKQNPSHEVIFSPGQPIPVQPGVDPDGIPRQYAFPLAYNTSGVNRTLNRSGIPTFETLRHLGEMCDAITSAMRVWKDLVPALTPRIQLRPHLIALGMNESDTDVQKAMTGYLNFFEKPDKQRDIHSWLRMLLEEQTQIDELYLFKRRTYDGKLYALECVAGDTMKPLLDDWGRIPDPSIGPAFKQFPWGLPGSEFTTDNFIHYQESPRAYSPYGFSRVQCVEMRVNQLLRKEKRDLAMFTEGNIPAGLMEVPEAGNWTPDQIQAFELMWNSLVAGNTQQQVRVKFTQPGMKYTKTDTGEILTDFDDFLITIVSGVYGVPKTYLSMTGDIHKSADKGQQNMLYSRTLKPIAIMYAKILTSVILNDFHDDRFIFTFGGYEEEEDFNAQATGFATLAGIGAVAPATVAHLMKLPDVPKTGPFIMTTSGPFFLKDYEEDGALRKASLQAQIQGQSFAAQNPGGVAPSQDNQEDEENDDDENTQQEEEGATGGGQKFKNAKPDSGKQEQAADKQGKTQKASSGRSQSSLSRANGSSSAQIAGSIGEQDERLESREDETNRLTDRERAIRSELRRWRTCALHDVERGKRVRPFESAVLSTEQRASIRDALTGCSTAEDVKAVFERAKEGDIRPKVEAVVSGGHQVQIS